MPANFARRRDVFLDAGYPDVPHVLDAIATEVAEQSASMDLANMGSSEALAGLRKQMQERLKRVNPDQRSLARLVPEWISDRGGDLTTALWLARQEHGEDLDVPGFLFAILDAFIERGQENDALAFGRFVLQLGFDWNKIYGDQSIAYEFLRVREPGPLVFRLLEEFSTRKVRLRVLELGCGVGNDAFGFLRSELVDQYVGVDLVESALEIFRSRLQSEPTTTRPCILQGDFAQVLNALPDSAHGTNLVYSYSSLHYFSSVELRTILDRVHALLSASSTPGFFGFGIKGAGSVWHGQGIALYRPDVFVNWDGQSRWFPSKRALERMLDDAGFEVHFHELHDHWGYSEYGRRDVFHYVLCRPRTHQ